MSETEWPITLPEPVKPFWHLPAGRDLDRRIEREVFGRAEADIAGKATKDYSTDMAWAWQIVEYLAPRAGYDHLGFEFSGPVFKAEDRYMTDLGYPLGTTCWFVRVCTYHLRVFFCAETPALAICRAALYAIAMEPTLVAQGAGE